MSEHSNHLSVDAAESNPVRRTILKGSLGAAGAAILTRFATDRTEAGERSHFVGSTGYEVIGRVDQNGANFVFYGYVTSIPGRPYTDLFTDPAQPSEATAKLTVYSTATMVSRAILENIFVIDAIGTFDVYFDPPSVPSFENPSSFADGTRVARSDLYYQSVINVQAPNQAIATGWGDLTQVEATPFRPGRRGTFQLGQPGLHARISATGQATRLEPTIPISEAVIAANIAFGDVG